jgi:hypothetical protein
MATLKSFFRRPIGRVFLALAATCAAVCGSAAIVNAGRARRQAHAS